MALAARKTGVVGRCVMRFLIILYGIVPTLQPANFGRVYAAYGGVFVILSIPWGWKIDRIRPDLYDITGGLICLISVAIIMYAPRA